MPRRPEGPKPYRRKGSRFWWIKYYINGKPRYESAQTEKLSEAWDLLRRRQVESRTGQLTPQNVKVADLLRLVEDDHRRQNRKSLYETKLRCRKLREFFGSWKAREVTTEVINRYVAARFDDGVKGPTINRERALFLRAYTLGTQQTPPMVLVRPHWPREAESPARQDYMPFPVFAKVRDAMTEPSRSVATYCYWTGCRRKEALTLRWAWVDLEERLALIPETKNGKPRNVPLSEEVWRALSRLRLHRDQFWPDCPWVFSRQGDKPLSKATFRSAWDRACAAMGLKLRFHATRHSAVTNLRRAGAEEGVSMEITGHRTRSVFDRYGIQPVERARKAMKDVESVTLPDGLPSENVH